MISWTPGQTLDDLEKKVILKAFKFYSNNKTTTAKALGIAIRTLDNKLMKYSGKLGGTDVDSKEVSGAADSATTGDKDIHSGTRRGNSRRGAGKSVPYKSIANR